MISEEQLRESNAISNGRKRALREGIMTRFEDSNLIGCDQFNKKSKNLIVEEFPLAKMKNFPLQTDANSKLLKGIGCFQRNLLSKSSSFTRGITESPMENT